MLMFSSMNEMKRWVKDEEENFFWKISINDSQYSHELWRCNWVMLEKSLSIIVNVLMNSEDATQ